MHAHSRTHTEHAQTRTRHLHVCACDLAGKHIRTCERTHIYASILTYWQPIDNLHIQAHARTHAGSGAGTRTHECARAQHVQTRVCACASTRECVDTAATLRAATHWKVRPFPIPSKFASAQAGCTHTSFIPAGVDRQLPEAAEPVRRACARSSCMVLPACACMLPISCSNACLNRIIVSVCAQQDTRTCACAPRATHRSKGTRECKPTHESQRQACHARSAHAQAHAHRRMHTRTHTNSCARARARTFALECVCLAFH